MDVTPRELRDLDIREKFRGYDQNDVDDLLERAARSIEELETQVRDLQQRVDAGAVDSAKVRESEDTIQRTLIMAQRAADEAVAEAQGKARQILSDAESRASAMVSEAETSARRAAETERRRLEGEVLELGARRDALVADVDALERFEADYRARLRRAVEADLEQLSAKGSIAPSARPTIHNVEMPTAAAAVTEVSEAPAVPPTPAPPVPPPAFGVAASDPAPPPAPADAPPTTTTAGAGASASGSAPSTTADAPWEEGSTPASIARPPLFEPEPPGAPQEHLDDDAFFASLREAVTDETPLGPRESGSEGYESDDGRGGLFRRRGR